MTVRGTGGRPSVDGRPFVMTVARTRQNLAADLWQVVIEVGLTSIKYLGADQDATIKSALADYRRLLAPREGAE